MTLRPSFCLLAIAVLFLSGHLRATGADPASLIEIRQQNFKEMGRAMKFFRDELRRDKPDTAKLSAAADVIANFAGDIAAWFPPGSGPESGIDTDALEYIWKNTEKFSLLDQQLVPAANALQAATSTGDRTAILKQVQEVGSACKACHKSFRAD